jgi:flagellar biosynthesis/type III secretory pathway protein FliH
MNDVNKAWSRGWNQGYVRGLEAAKTLIDKEFEKRYKQLVRSTTQKRKSRAN